jgi:hypothetical protein
MTTGLGLVTFSGVCVPFIAFISGDLSQNLTILRITGYFPISGTEAETKGTQPRVAADFEVRGAAYCHGAGSGHFFGVCVPFIAPMCPVCPKWCLK